MNLVTSIHDYIRKKGGHFFRDWTREALEDKIEFHLQDDTISIAIDHDGNVCGVFIGWCQRGSEHIPWKWQHNNTITGDTWWIDQFMADCPCVAASLAVKFCEKWPQIAHMPTAMHRRGKLKKAPPGYLFKVYKKAETLYGN